MSSKRRSSQNFPAPTNRLRLDSLNKILKIDGDKSRKHKKEAFAKQVSKIALTELLKSTPQKTLDVPDFKTFLSDEENVKLFREFLKTQYCQENIDFYLACEKYRRLDPARSGFELHKFMANQIFNDFLSESARQPVNIDYQCLQNIRRSMRDPKPDLLFGAQTEIFNLMKEDCYPRFCKTWLLDKETAKKILRDRPVNLDHSHRSNSTTLSDQVRLRRPCRTPPPPPLPPRVQEADVGLPVTDNNKLNRAFVGKVFNV